MALRPFDRRLNMSSPGPAPGPTSLTDRTLGGLGSLFLGAGVQTLIQLAVISVLARLLSPTEFGLIGAATVMVSFTSIFSQSGLGPAVVQRPDLGSQHLRVAHTLSILLGLLSCLALYLAAPMVAGFFLMPELEAIVQMVSLALPIAGTALVPEALIQRQMRFRELALIAVMSYAVGYGAVGIALALAGYGVWSLVGAQLGQVIVSSAMLLIRKRCKLGWPTWTWPEARDLLIFGAGLSLSKISNQLATQGDNLLVGRLLGADALGIYGRAYSSGVMPANLFGGVVDKVLFPTLASIQNEKARLARGFIQALAALSTIAVPASAMLIVLAPELIVTLFGPQWSAAILPFRILSLALLFRVSYKLCDALARATGSVYRQAWRHFVYAIAVVIGSWLGHFWELHGIATGVALAIFLHYLLMLQLSLALTGASWADVLRAHLAPLVSAIALGLFAQFLADAARGFHVSPPLVLLVVSGITASVYLLVLRYSPQLLGRETVWLARLLIARYRGLQDHAPIKSA